MLVHDPLVFIGLPLYNNGRTLRRALDAIVEQTERRFQVLMSDDGSSDETIAIAREYAAQDSRFSIVVQPKNLNYGNFRYLVSEASAPFFVFLAGDDWWEPTFLASCLEALDADAHAVCVVTRVVFESPDGDQTISRSTASLEGEVVSRVARYLQNPSDNSRMYGVFRLECARRAFPSQDYFAYDWGFSAATLLEGSHKELPTPLLHRETTPSTSYVRYVRRDNKSWITRVFPLLPLSMDLLRRAAMPKAWPIVRALIKQNIEYHLKYAQTFMPRYYRLALPVMIRLLWRVADG